jgi:coenzyme F420 hydrogenase subunit beta
MALAALDLASAGLGSEARVAVVGTPCEIQGIRAMQARPWRRGGSRVDAVVLTIALLCTKSFDYRKLLLKELRDDRGIDLERLARLDVIHGRLLAQDQAGATILDEPIKAFHGAALKGCDECADFLGRAADISVGSVGSEAGFSSVLIRTDAGLRAFNRAAPGLEIGELSEPAALERLDRLDKKVTGKSLQRELDPDGPLFVDLAEHVTFYGGTDRAPVWR